MTDASLVCFRQDLRIADNPALQAAVRRGAPVIPVFIWSPDEEGRWTPGAASRWWLHQSLAELNESLRAIDSRLILRLGPTGKTIRNLVGETGATAIYWNRRYEPSVVRRDRRVEAGLRKQGLVVEGFNGSLLFEPPNVLTKAREPFRVFTPFWRACRAMPSPEPPQSRLGRLRAPGRWPQSLRLSELALESEIDWASGIRATWTPGEMGAREQLRRFCAETLATYRSDRDRPDRPGTSRLSPHLHFGELSVREIWHRLTRRTRGAATDDSAGSYLRELGWREFAYHLLYHFPETTDKPLRQSFSNFPWRSNQRNLQAWQRGRTGFPIIDAGMRELWTTGWMHNRLRMVVASFLVKDLLIPWQKGAAWFWDTLVDADLANNTFGWQWTAGCGADAAPFFRIFNPVLQAKKFDPDGEYVRRWVPELAQLPADWIHEPAQAPLHVLAQSGVRLGVSYPKPLLDHRQASRRAVAAYRGRK